jgi:hypothetical protein
MGKAVMGTGRGRGRKGNSRTAAGQDVLDRGRLDGKVQRRDPDKARRDAATAGQLGAAAEPTPGARRAANYRRQLAGAPGKFVAQLSPKQAKRLRKQANKHGDRVGQYETAALPYVAVPAKRAYQVEAEQLMQMAAYAR